MKKCCSLLAFILILLWSASILASPAYIQTGSSFYFGHYEQDNDEQTGVEPIEWIVLNVKGGKALLISKYILDCQPYHEIGENTNWENSSLRTWLNTFFYETAFTKDEYDIICETTHSNSSEDGNPEWALNLCPPTSDRVFLLSWKEANEFFPEDSQRKTDGTEYARSVGAKFLGVTSVGFSSADWWLRSPGINATEAAYVGVIRSIHTKAVKERIGIRPAVWVNLEGDFENLPYAQYAEALNLSKGGNYEAAITLLENLGNYNNSKRQIVDCKYNWAVQLSESGEYKKAVELFEEIKDYKDSSSLGRKARYQHAVAEQEAGNYTDAVRLFSEVGQYEDSMTRMKDCMGKAGIAFSFLNAEPVNTGVDNGYSGTSEIGGKDKHFGWSLGRFFVSNYTQIKNQENEDPVIVKTLGDSVTLWFELQQDIDSLNHKNLSIADDRNGFDSKFKVVVPEEGFGRGTLIIRHTDYRNDMKDPIIYTNYLLAKGTSGADTKVILNEEGDYEVALDYETVDNRLTSLTDKYGNYRTSFKFKIRNGNCMVYPFDVKTHAELQNTSITKDGFYLDLARSRYLEILVKRSILVDNGSGIVEDERFNSPAKDGDQYTAEGIYTITVHNRYTDEKTVKTIFVGPDDLLQEYVNKGFSLNRLN